MVAVPRGPGYTGRRWVARDAKGWVLYYAGEEEEVRVVDAETGCRGAPVTRGCIGLGEKRSGGGKEDELCLPGEGMRRVSSEDFWARVAGLPARREQQGCNPRLPHEEVDLAGGGLWAMGGGGRGYVALDDQRSGSAVIRFYAFLSEIRSLSRQEGGAGRRGAGALLCQGPISELCL